MSDTGWPVRKLLAALLVLAWTLGGAPLEAGDLEEAMRAVVRVRATVPPEAITARTLGTERQGNGILIDSEGLILTIGYLIVEAESVEVHSPAGVFKADFVGYDGDTGFGLVRARALSALKPMPLGESSEVAEGERLHVGGFGSAAQPVRLISRGEFVGYWEYLLDDALYVAPAYAEFGGAALIRGGTLVGVGSILTNLAVAGVGRVPGNMFVPIDLLKPILQELVRSGRSSLPPRPWLGLNAVEVDGRVVVTVVTAGGPAEQAGLRPGDLILEVERQPVAGVAEFYRRLWATGPAGVSVRLRVLRGERIQDLSVESADRNERYRSRPARPGGVASAAQGR